MLEMLKEGFVLDEAASDVRLRAFACAVGVGAGAGASFQRISCGGRGWLSRRGGGGRCCLGGGCSDCRRHWLLGSAFFRDGDSSAVHVELLLAVDPSPSEDDIASRNVRGNGEVEVLAVRAITSVSVWAVPFVARRNLEGGSLVDAEADLARSAIVVADAGDVEVLLTASGPGSDGRSFGKFDEVKVAAAWHRRSASAAAVWVVEERVTGTCSVGIIRRVEGSWIV